MSNLILILILILIVYTFNYFVFEKFKSHKHNYLFLFLIFISVFSILTVGAKQENEPVSDENLKLLENQFSDTKEKKLFNKVVVVGDSRMSLIVDDDDLLKPFNFMFVAKSAMKIDWLENYALGQVKEILKNDNYNYHIVVNMGVNDLNDDVIKADEISEKYFKLYKNLAKEYPEAKVYLLSVNPIDDKTINEKWSTNNRTTAEINLFNKTTQKELKRKSLDNMYYCDSYHSINFETYDGLHYTEDTNKKILNYIDNECVQY